MSQPISLKLIFGRCLVRVSAGLSLFSWAHAKQSGSITNRARPSTFFKFITHLKAITSLALTPLTYNRSHPWHWHHSYNRSHPWHWHHSPTTDHILGTDTSHLQPTTSLALTSLTYNRLNPWHWHHSLKTHHTTLHMLGTDSEDNYLRKVQFLPNNIY
jgi:hypothetical protein